MKSTLETFELKSLPASSFFVSIEENGGGAELCGPFPTEIEAKLFVAELDEYQQEISFIYNWTEAIEKFCD